MHILDWIADRLNVRDPLGISDPLLCAVQENKRLIIQAYAFELCLDFVARYLSAATIVTKKEGVKIEETMHYRLNVEPNQNETASAFWQKVVRKMLVDGECLVVPIEQPGRKPDMYHVADSFDTTKREMLENRYTNIRIGEYTLDKRKFKTVFRESEVWRFTFHNEEIRSKAKMLTLALEDILHVVQTQYRKKKYTKSVIEVPGMFNQTDEEATKRRKLFEKTIRDFLNTEKDAALPLGNNQKIGRFESVMGDGVIDDAQNIRMFTELAIQLNAAMFNIPVAALYGEEVDLTGWITSFLKPLTEHMSREINRKSYRQSNMQQKSYCYFDLTKLIPQSELDRARMLDILLRAGTHTINDNRLEMGLEPIQEDWADQLWMTLNYDFVHRFVQGNQGSRGAPGEGVTEGEGELAQEEGTGGESD